jgi:hypothetical protein
LTNNILCYIVITSLPDKVGTLFRKGGDAVRKSRKGERNAQPNQNF